MKGGLATLALGGGLALVASELKITRATRPLRGEWPRLTIEPRRARSLGISFRPPQAEVLGLDVRATLRDLLSYPFQVIRLAAYWNRIESDPGRLVFDELDWQIDAAEQHGKQIIVCVGALKSFTYPEFFVPRHRLPRPLREGALVRPADHQSLLAGATEFVSRVVERYKQRSAIVAWQVEHEAVDPLGMEHSWRLSTDFVEREVSSVRRADPTRPILMNGFLPTSLLVGLQQWWRTRDQGDSLDVAQQLADIVGIDFYPRHGLISLGPLTVYLDGSRRPWQRRRRTRLFAWAKSGGGQLMISEGQAEPWETVTRPPDPSGQAMYSCLPEDVILNYNQCMRWAAEADCDLNAYLFWGAEYWMLRRQGGDTSYLGAFARILDAG